MAQYCSEHEDDMMNKICKRCDTIMCTSCFLPGSRHEGHEFERLSVNSLQALVKRRVDLWRKGHSYLLANVDKVRHLLQQARRRLDEACLRLTAAEQVAGNISSDLGQQSAMADQLERAVLPLAETSQLLLQLKPCAIAPPSLDRLLDNIEVLSADLDVAAAAAITSASVVKSVAYPPAPPLPDRALSSALTPRSERTEPIPERDEPSFSNSVGGTSTFFLDAGDELADSVPSTPHTTFHGVARAHSRFAGKASAESARSTLHASSRGSRSECHCPAGCDSSHTERSTAHASCRSHCPGCELCHTERLTAHASSRGHCQGGCDSSDTERSTAHASSPASFEGCDSSDPRRSAQHAASRGSSRAHSLPQRGVSKSARKLACSGEESQRAGHRGSAPAIAWQIVPAPDQERECAPAERSPNKAGTVRTVSFVPASQTPTKDHSRAPTTLQLRFDDSDAASLDKAGVTVTAGGRTAQWQNGHWLRCQGTIQGPSTSWRFRLEQGNAGGEVRWWQFGVAAAGMCTKYGKGTVLAPYFSYAAYSGEVHKQLSPATPWTKLRSSVFPKGAFVAGDVVWFTLDRTRGLIVIVKELTGAAEEHAFAVGETEALTPVFVGWKGVAVTLL